MKVRALCTDIDGTLLDDRKALSAFTIATIRKAKDSMPVILASSRMPAAMRHLQHELGIADHPLICYNGGYVIHFGSGIASPHVFSTTTIAPAIAAAILDLTKTTSIHVSLYYQDEWYAPQVDYWTDREQRITKVNAIITDAGAVLADWQARNCGAHKVMCMGPEDEIHALEHQLQTNFSSQIHIYRSRPTYLELAPRSISKATALALILKEKYGIAMADVLAFGDNYNDVDMLQSVGLGIAVANAKDEVKAVAKALTHNSVDDGVAHAIEKYCW